MSFLRKYEKYLSPGALAVGFILDWFTLNRIDQRLDNLILLTYLFLIGTCIILLSRYNPGALPDLRGQRTARWLLIIMQFAFGGIFSGYVVFYSRSSSLITSWPFMLTLVTLLVGNEFFRKRYLNLTFQMSLYYVAIFSFLIFSIPVLLHRMGAWIFILSGVISLAIMRGLGFVLSKVSPEMLARNKRALITSVSAIFIVFNILYFTNIIPPIPLSLKDSGIYHNVVRANGEYELTGEDKPWYKFVEKPQKIHIAAGSGVYSYSSVFAPTDLNTKILHEWAIYNETTGQWNVTDRIPFTISGGRDGGYRGYTRKSSLSEGLWRVDVITERGALLGRETFRLIRPVNNLDIKLETSTAQ